MTSRLAGWGFAGRNQRSRPRGRTLRPRQCHMHSRRGISEQAGPSSPTSSCSSTGILIVIIITDKTSHAINMWLGPAKDHSRRVDFRVNCNNVMSKLLGASTAHVLDNSWVLPPLRSVQSCGFNQRFGLGESRRRRAVEERRRRSVNGHERR